METRLKNFSEDGQGELFDTLFFQGNGSSQTQAAKYIVDDFFTATTGEKVWSTGKNNQKPLKVIYRLHIGAEIADVNLKPFSTFAGMLNPINVIGAATTRFMNWYNGCHFLPATNATPESVAYHSIKLSEYSLGQETDMASHRLKYDTWLKRADKTDSLILWGVSRGTAATFCAFAKEHYKEVKLVVLEGAIDSVDEVLSKRVENRLKSPSLAKHFTRMIRGGLSFFNGHNVIKYDPNGPSPLKSVGTFPEGVPVVFITSKVDSVVPCSNTENIAQKLVDKGKNDVFVLKLKKASHSDYMYDDETDRNNYEAFIHAVYKEYHLQHDPFLAEKGRDLLIAATRFRVSSNTNTLRMMT